MNNQDNTNMSSWERIQSGVRETERLIGQKKYNMAMIKARQTLEYMVKCLCEKSGITEGSLIDMIDALYEEETISKTTCEHYHKIRTIGNKAIHEEDNSAYNANQAHHLLSQEVYTFANDYSERRKKTPAPKRRPTEDTGRKSGRTQSSRRRRAYSSGPSIDPGSIIKPILLIAIIIVLLFIIKMIRPAQTDVTESTAPSVATETMSSSQEDTTEAEAETEEAAAVMYRTTDTLNVRPAPSTDDARIGVLAPDTEVEYVGDYDEQWAIIMFNGQEAYVSKEFLTPAS